MAKKDKKKNIELKETNDLQNNEIDPELNFKTNGEVYDFTLEITSKPSFFKIFGSNLLGSRKYLVPIAAVLTAFPFFTPITLPYLAYKITSASVRVAMARRQWKRSLPLDPNKKNLNLAKGKLIKPYDEIIQSEITNQLIQSKKFGNKMPFNTKVNENSIRLRLKGEEGKLKVVEVKTKRDGMWKFKEVKPNTEDKYVFNTHERNLRKLEASQIKRQEKELKAIKSEAYNMEPKDKIQKMIEADKSVKKPPYSTYMSSKEISVESQEQVAEQNSEGQTQGGQ